MYEVKFMKICPNSFFKYILHRMQAGLKIVKFLARSVIPKFNKFTTQAFSSKYLLCTNVTISLTLSGLGDVIEQRYEILTGDLQKWNPVRTRHMSTSGVTVGVLCHFWYKFLDSRITGHTLKMVFKKIIIDQFVGSPLCISTFFITLAALEGATLAEFTEEVKQKAWRLYLAEWIIWPPAQFINFYFLPTKFRVLYDNIISLGYDVYTSYVKHDKVP